MKTRWGLAAIVAAGLIVVGVLSTSGQAQATLSKMHKAVTEVHSSHLQVQIEQPIDLGQKDEGNGEGDVDVTGLLGSGKTIDVWSEGNKWKAQIFGGIEAYYDAGEITVAMGGKVMVKTKADDKDVPKDMGDYLFKELSKTTAERLTLDLGLTFRTAHESMDFGKMVIAEVKREKANSPSPVIAVLNERRIRTGSISKYCLGLISTHAGLRKNNFVEQIRHFQRILNDAA